VKLSAKKVSRKDGRKDSFCKWTIAVFINLRLNFTTQKKALSAFFVFSAKKEGHPQLRLFPF
jgi:hypothetical protein